MTRLFEALGCHGRTIEVNSTVSDCMECGVNQNCLEFDSSDTEYTSMVFCKSCINKFFDGYVSKSSYLTRDLSGQAPND